MRQLLRSIASVAILAVATACSSTSADIAGPVFAKGGGSGGTTPAISPNLAGHWKQDNIIHITTSLGTTDYWYEMDVTQSGSTLGGTAVRHLNTFNFDGSPWLVDFTGSPGKITGTVNANGTATITFNRIHETKVTETYSVTLSASGSTLVVKTPVALGPTSFTR